MRLLRAKKERDERSGFSARWPKDEPARSSWDEKEPSMEDVIEEPGDWREEVEVVVLLLERPKTERRLGL